MCLLTIVKTYGFDDAESKHLIYFEGTFMTKLLLIITFCFSNFFVVTAHASTTDFIRDMLVDACGTKMKKAVINTKFEFRLWGGGQENVYLSGLVRISANGKTVDSYARFAFEKVDPFEEKYKPLKDVSLFPNLGFASVDAIEKAFDCTETGELNVYNKIYRLNLAK